MSVEKMLERYKGDDIIDAEFPCPEIGILTTRQALDLVGFGEEIGLQPLPHNRAGDILWDVKAQAKPAEGVPRSHTSDEFTWHTDASFERVPPRYFMLHVLRGDKFGGGTQNFMPLGPILDSLGDDIKETLAHSSFPWSVPLEFRKEEEEVQLPVLFEADSPEIGIRYREECVLSSAIEPDQKYALEALKNVLFTGPKIEHQPQAGELLLVDNWRALHARDHILDPDRHLQRVRFQ